MLCEKCNDRGVTVTWHLYPDGADAPESHAFCASCAADYSGTPLAAHRFTGHFDGPDEFVLRIRFTWGDVFRLCRFETVDPTIYGDADRWNAEVVQAVHGKHPKFERHFRVGSLLDFNETDVAEIIDDATGLSLYSKPETEHPGA